MMTSDHAVLFTKEDCAPCTDTKAFLKEVLTDEPGLGMFISVLRKEHHSQLVATYKLETYPTLLVVDEMGEELSRVIGGKKIREYLKDILSGIRILNNV